MGSELTIKPHRPAHVQPVLAQSAALCYRIEKGKPRVLLITTRGSRRWIIPKGWLSKDLSPDRSATREAWEEAGAIGHGAKMPLGRFSYVKNRPGKGPALVLVDVFPLFVQRLASKYPESGERKRRWFSPKKASQRVAFPELAALLRGFDPKLN